MKKCIIYAIGISISLWGCGSTDSHKDHSGEQEHQTVGDDHDHDHDHEGHAHGEGDEIYLTIEQAKMMGVETEQVEYRPFHQVIKTSGQVIAAQGDERTIVASISGAISFSKISVNEGSPVKRGESIFTISSKNLAEGDPIVKAQNAYEVAKREFDRAEKLIVDRLISQKEYNEIKLTYENAKIAYEAISGGAGARGANISSPINGYIKSKLVNEGQFVNVGDPLMVVTQNSKLQLRADVSQRYYRDLQMISSANVKIPYDSAIYRLAEMNGKVLSYAKSAGESEYYLPVIFEFDNIGNIVPGSFVEVYLLSSIKENALTIPKSSLTDEQGLYFVYCQLTDEEYIRKEVQIGSSDGVRVEVLGGLDIGDQIVTKGAYHVKLAKTSGAIPDSHHH